MVCRKHIESCVLVALAVALVSVQTVARADVIGAEQYVRAMDRQLTVDSVTEALAREDVQRALRLHGVDPTLAAERVAALNDQELMALAADLEELPVGGSLLGALGIAAIVIVILELLDVIDIFKKF